jgi:predicted GNAT superfamily acetyltransferase
MPNITLLEYSDSELKRGSLKDSQPARLEIPAQFFVLGRDNPVLARTWQTALREILTDVFAQGFAAVDFIREGGRCWYVLMR